MTKAQSDMAQFLTIDDLILCPYSDGILLDEHNLPFSFITGEIKRFTLHLAHSRGSASFIRIYLPHWPTFDLFPFELKLIKGKPLDKSTWIRKVAIDKCYINLFDETSINKWLARYNIHFINRDETFFYDIPICVWTSR